MANILGQIMVVLGVNTASFEQGMNASSKFAQKTGKDIEGAFQSVGSTVERIFGAMGPMAGQFSTALYGVGTSARTLLGELGPLAGGLGSVGIGVAGIAAIGVAAEAALVGIALHAAEATAHLGELAQSTGIAVETLSLLGEVAATRGIGLDEMGKALERMSRNAFQAAQGAGLAKVAFTTLGIAVRDAAGNLKDAHQLFNEIAQAMARMPDGTEKTALAMQIFGRAGANLIPLLDRVGKGADELEGHFEKLGAVVSGSMTKGAEQMKEDETIIGAAFTGMANRIEADLLPALNELASEMIQFFEQNHGLMVTFIDDLAWGTKATLGMAGTFKSVFEFIGFLFESGGRQALAFFNAVGAGMEAVTHATVGNFSGAKAAFKAGYDGLKQESQRFLDENNAIWQKNADFISRIMGGKLPYGPFAAPQGGEAPPEKEKRQPGEAIIERLRAQTDAELQLAAAGSQSVAAQRLQLASGQADEIISRVLEVAHGKITTALQKEIATIHALTAERQVAKDAIQTNQELEKQVEVVQRQIESNKLLAASYLEGGTAILEAKVEQKLAPQIQAARHLREEYELLKKAADDYAESTRRLGGAIGPVQGLNIRPEALAIAKGAAAHAEQQVATLRTTASTEELTKYEMEINQTKAALAGEQPLLEALDVAYLENAQVVRQAQVALALYHWEQAHPGARPEQILEVNAQLKQQSIDAQRTADVRLAGEHLVGKAYDDEIAKLSRAKEVLQQYGQSTLLIDSQIYDAQARNLKQWDDAALKVGTFGDKYKAVMNELVLQGQDAGKKIANAFLGAIDSAETELAKGLTGQKVDTSKIVQNLAEQVTKAEIQHTVGAIAGRLGIEMPAGRPDGTAASPLHVRVVNPGEPSKAPGDTVGGWHSLWSGIIDLFHKKPAGIPGLLGGVPLVEGEIPPQTTAGLPIPGVGELATRNLGWPAIINNLLGGSSTTAPGKHADGTSASPYYVVNSTLAGIQPGGLPTEPGTGGGVLGKIGSIFGLGSPTGASAVTGQPDGTDANPFYIAMSSTSAGTSSLPFMAGGAPTAIPRVIGGMSSEGGGFGGLLSIFGLAAGGPVRSGDQYLVGERGPELFRASRDGEIVPNHALVNAARATPNMTTVLERDFSRERFNSLTSHGLTELRDSEHLASELRASEFASERFDSSTLREMQPWLASFGGARAVGGPIQGGTSYMIGEHGPELFRASRDGEILPNHLLHLLDNPMIAPNIAVMPDFAGFMADGGDVFAGNSYIVGERGKEVYRSPGVSNVSHSNVSSNRSGHVYHGNVYHGPVVNQTIKGADTNDLFKRTARQETARMMRHLT